MVMKFTNNATSTLATGINNSVTSLSVASGQGALFPTLGGSDYFYCTLANAAGTVEIVKVTARSTDTFTIVRGQDNTTAASWLSGDRVELRLVAASLNDIPKLDEANAFTTAPTFSTALAVASGGTGAATFTANNVLLGNGTSALQTVAPGTSGNVLTSNGSTWQSSAASGVSLSTANTWTATQTFNGTSSTLGTVLLDTAETVNVVGSAPSSTTNLYVQSGSVQYYTSNAANNFVVNLAFSSGTSMNTALSTNQSVTAALITTQSATAYYATSVQVDGTTSGVTTRWIGGAPTAGNASGLDVYRFAVIKTASATYTVLASVTQYKA
jgi:hypothetical protein